MNKRLMTVLLVLSSITVRAEVYQWTDAQGQRHYGDHAQGEAARSLSITPSTSYHRVQKVYDGDTILLDDGQKVRFLGINTPEVAGRNHDEQSGGRAAKNWLKDKLEGKRVSLQGDVEKHDHYQRTLAYVFTEDKEHINVSLVRNGLAMVNVYPPNLLFVDDLLAAQSQAERERKGLWSDADYQPMQADALNEDTQGWHRVVGRLRAVKHGPKNTYIQFSNQQAVQINQEYLRYFPELQSYVGKRVEARGWVHRNGDRYAVAVRHPTDIKLLD